MGLQANSTYTPEDFCLQCINTLDNHPLAPNKIKKDLGLLDKLESSANNDYWDIVECSFAGKPATGTGEKSYPKLTLSYTKPICDDGVDIDCDDTVCTDGRPTEDDQGYLEMAVDMCVSDKITITCEEFDQICESPKERWAKELRRMHYQMRRRKSKKVHEVVYAALSDYPSGNPSTGGTAASVPIVTTDGRVNNSGFAKIMATYRDANYFGDLCTVGGATLASYFDIAKLAACDRGCDLDALDLDFAYDSQIDRSYQEWEGDKNSHGITFPMGAFGVKSAQENTGYKAVNDEQYLANTLLIDGTLYDYWVKKDYCPELKWTIMLRERFCVPCIPDNLYCDNTGFKYHWLFKCGNFDCDVLKSC